MRQRIDITEVEAATKIRAQVPARARERGVGPAAGPDVRQDVPAHVRGVPGARPAAAGRGVPAALRAPATHGPDAVRAGASGRARRRRRPRRCSARARGRARARADPGARCYAARQLRATTSRRAEATTAPPTPTATPAKKKAKKRRRSRGAHARHPARSRATGAVYVCLDDARRHDGDQRARRCRPATALASVPLASASASLRQRRRARMRVNGTASTCAAACDPIGYEMRPGKRPRELSERRAADLQRERPRGHRRHRHRGAVGRSSPTATGRGCPSACASAASTLTHIVIVGDRREDLRVGAATSCATGVDLIVTSGGLGPTADDLTAEVVAEFAAAAMALDAALEERIWAILERLRARWRTSTRTRCGRAPASRRSCPTGATVLEPVGTAPGPGRPGRRRRRSLVLPGAAARAAADVGDGAGDRRRCASCWRARRRYEQRIMRLFGIPESEIARDAARDRGRRLPLERLEITTCLRRGEIEIATVFEPPPRRRTTQFEAAIRERHADALFSDDGATIDDQVIARCWPGARWRRPSRAPAG